MKTTKNPKIPPFPHLPPLTNEHKQNTPARPSYCVWVPKSREASPSISVHASHTLTGPLDVDVALALAATAAVAAAAAAAAIALKSRLLLWPFEAPFMPGSGGEGEGGLAGREERGAPTETNGETSHETVEDI